MLKQWNKGQSVVELLVSVGAMSLLMVALLSLVVLSIRNSRLSKNRVQAVALVQEGLELMRAYRDYSWLVIAKKAKDGGSYRLPANWTVETGLTEVNCDKTAVMADDSEFSRCVVLAFEDEKENEIKVTVAVAWQSGNKWQQVEQTTKLSLWER